MTLVHPSLAAICSLFPLTVGVGIRVAGQAALPDLWPGEEALLADVVHPTRRLHVMLGRAAARDALRRLGIKPVAIGRGRGGEPLWPDGVVGSIAHTGHLAVAVAGRTRDYRGIGMDVERLDRRLSDGAIQHVCTPAELRWVRAGADARRRALQLFSSKEAIFKAVFSATSIGLGYLDAELARVDHPPGFAATLLRDVDGRIGSGTTLPVRVWTSDDLVVCGTQLRAETSASG